MITEKIIIHRQINHKMEIQDIKSTQQQIDELLKKTLDSTQKTLQEWREVLSLSDYDTALRLEAERIAARRDGMRTMRNKEWAEAATYRSLITLRSDNRRYLYSKKYGFFRIYNRRDFKQSPFKREEAHSYHLKLISNEIEYYLHIISYNGFGTVLFDEHQQIRIDSLTGYVTYHSTNVQQNPSFNQYA